MTAILICDERPLARLTLSQAIQAIISASDIDCVSDGFALADAFAAKPADLVLIATNHRADPEGGPHTGPGGNVDPVTASTS